MIPELQTKRLLLRPLDLADAPQTQLLFPHWEIVRFLRNVVPWPYPPDGARNYYENVALPAIARGDEWHWNLRLKTAPDQLIGSIGLFKGENDNRGFWLGLPWQGQGLMTEATEAVTGYWFNVLKFSALRVQLDEVHMLDAAFHEHVVQLSHRHAYHARRLRHGGRLP